MLCRVDLTFFSANRSQMPNARGAVWHRESFDHMIRSPGQLARIEEYIRDNPKSLPLSRITDESSLA